jgi:tetratricopeptide (TPR) repeat protein
MIRDRDAEALAYFEKAMAMAPEEARAWIGRARMHEKAGRDDAAFADIQHAHQLEPDNGTVLYHLGRVLNQRGQHQQALDAINRALPRLTGDRETMARALARRCRIRADLGIELQAALDDCAVSELDANAVPPNNGHLRRAFVLYRMQRYDEVLAQLEQTTWRGKDSAFPLYLRGLTRRAQGQLAAGDADMAEAVKLDPEVAAELAEYRPAP